MRARIALVAALAGLAAAAPARAEQLAPLGNFDSPMHLAAAPGDDSRLYVVERGGTIEVLQGATVSRFLDVDAADPVGLDGEEGLFSIAFPPDHQASGRLYVFYTVEGGLSNRISEFTRTSPVSAAPASRRTVLDIPHPANASNHNGGQIAFGPDGLLYVASGDGGSTPDAAQDPNSLSGKVLRIDPLGGSTEILHRGLRNPFRFSFDRATGDLVIGDVGQGSAEEATLLPAGTAAGRNLGWPICEGASPCTPPADYAAPAFDYPHASGGQAITGGFVARDPALSLAGHYVYADFFEGVIRSRALAPFAAERGHGAAVPGLPAVGQLVSFGEDNGGCLYVVSLVGPVHRLAPDGVANPPQCAAVTAGADGLDGQGPAAGADRRAPLLRILGRPRIGRDGVVTVRLRPDEDGVLAASGTIATGSTAANYRLRGLRRTLRAGRSLRLRLRPRRARARRAVRRALRRGAHARARVTLRATDRAGNVRVRRVRARSPRRR